TWTVPDEESRPVARATTDDGAEGEPDLAVGLVLNRPGEHLAVGEVPQALRRDPGAALHTKSEVGVLGHQSDRGSLLELLGQQLELLSDLPPRRHRIFELQPP